MSLPSNPWHQLWTRGLDATTGVAGSAESLPSLTTQWWEHSMQASQQWWSWWFAAFMPPTGWGAQDPAGQVPVPPASEPLRREPPHRSTQRAAPSTADAPVRRPKAAAKHARKG